MTTVKNQQGSRDFHFWINMSDDNDLQALKKLLITEYKDRDASNLDMAIYDRKTNLNIGVGRCYNCDNCPENSTENYRNKCLNRRNDFDFDTIEEWANKVIETIRGLEDAFFTTGDESGRANYDFNSMTRIMVNLGGEDYPYNKDIYNPEPSYYTKI